MMYEDYSRNWATHRGKGYGHTKGKGGKLGKVGKNGKDFKGRGKGWEDQLKGIKGGKKGLPKGFFGRNEILVEEWPADPVRIIERRNHEGAYPSTAAEAGWKSRACGAPNFAEEKRIVLQMATVCTPPAGDRNHWSYEAPVHQELDHELGLASHELLSDRQVALVCSRAQGDLLRHFSDELRDDIEVVRAALMQDRLSLCFASEALQGNKEFVLECVRACGFALEYASPELQADREVVLAAAMNEAIALEDASPELMADRDFILTVLMHKRPALAFASEALRADRDLALLAVSSFGGELRHVNEALQADKEVVLLAVRNNGDVLRYASAGLRADREVVLTAVQSSGRALEFASDGLKADKVVVLQAIENCSNSVRSASPELKLDKDFLLLAARVCGNAETCYEEADESIKATIPLKIFLATYMCSVAVPGQQAPILSVALNRAFCTEGDAYLAEVFLLSGTTFSVEVSGQSRLPATLSDLASVLLEELPKHSEVKGVTHVFITFLDDNGENVPATVWDWCRPLGDFQQAQSSTSTNAVSATTSISTGC